MGVTIASLLVGCGGSSETPSVVDDQVVGSTEPSVIKYKIIDGYLGGVDVCVIPPNSSVCNYVGTTDVNGIVAIDSGITGTIVAQVVAGKATDTDIVGFVPTSYEMMAEISKDTPNVITPFTTIDTLDTTKSMSDIAAELNLSEDVIASDYIVSADATQSHAHALARFMASQLANQIGDNDVAQLYSIMNLGNNYITEKLLNTATNLDAIQVHLQYGSVYHTSLMPTLGEYLEQGPLTMLSLSTPFFAYSGAQDLVFNNSVVTLSGESSAYSINGNTLNLGGDGEDKFLYVSDKFSLSVPVNDKDLVLISPIDFANGHALFSTEHTRLQNELASLAGQTRYLIFDDALVSGSKPEPSFVKIDFINKEKAILTEEGEQIEITWSYDSFQFPDLIFGNILILHMGEHNTSDIRLFELMSDEHISIMDINRGVTPPQLLFKDEHLAKAIFEKWTSI